MKTKKLVGLSIILKASFLMMLSCQESDSLQKQVKSYTFDGTEGGAITFDVANSWINNFAAQNPSTTKAHFFGQETIKKLLSANGAMGIRIYYSITDTNSSELLLTGTDGSGNDLLTVFGVKGVTSKTELMGVGNTSFRGTEGSAVTTDVARQWIVNYKSKNPAKTQAHFFGHEIINQILAQKNCIGIRIYYAMNNAGVPQLLLVGVSAGGSNLLPSADENAKVDDNSGIIGDMSYPCPTYCSGT